MYVNGNNEGASYDAIPFDGFGFEHNSKQIKKFILNENFITNIYRIQAYDSIMCGYFCIRFIDFMLKGKSLLDYTNLSSITEKFVRKNLYCIFCAKHRKIKNPKISYISEKALVLSIICSKGVNEDEKMFKEEESIEILKIIGSIKSIILLYKYG